jgi:hypothetical protein
VTRARRALLVALCACSNQRAQDEEDAHMKELAASTFRAILKCGAPAMRDLPRCSAALDLLHTFESVRVEPLGKGSARYVFKVKTDRITRFVLAEYPGKVLDELTAAGLPYSVKSRD